MSAIDHFQNVCHLYQGHCIQSFNKWVSDITEIKRLKTIKPPSIHNPNLFSKSITNLSLCMLVSTYSVLLHFPIKSCIGGHRHL